MMAVDRSKTSERSSSGGFHCGLVPSLSFLPRLLGLLLLGLRLGHWVRRERERE